MNVEDFVANDSKVRLIDTKLLLNRLFIPFLAMKEHPSIVGELLIRCKSLSAFETEVEGLACQCADVLD